MRKILLVFVLLSVFVLAACQTDTTTDRVIDDNDNQINDPVDDETNEDPMDNEDPDDNTEMLQLTLEQLAMYDGQDGNKAYIAVNGKVYDVTGIAAWEGGTHNGNYAGRDLTDEIMDAPHGEAVLGNLEQVGVIVE